MTLTEPGEVTPSQLSFGPEQSYAASDALSIVQLTLNAQHVRPTSLGTTTTSIFNTLNLNWMRYGVQSSFETGAVTPAPIDAKALPNPPVVNSELCLFSVLVACEWNPDNAYVRELQWAFRRASDFLFDVSNGLAAFGQVIIGGPEYLPHADIQILASNRWHPRSWVSGLYQDNKRRPIRLGKTLWIKSLSLDVPWSEPEGYRVLVHEWLHYAFGLKDSYITSATLDANTTVYIPSLHVPSVMSNPNGTSELDFVSPSGNPATHGWEALIEAAMDSRHPLNGMNLAGAVNNRGPYYLPLPLPEFIDQRPITVSPFNDQSIDLPANLSHCWAFIIDGEQLIALGRHDSPGQLSIPAANTDGYILLIGHESGQQRVYRRSSNGWQNITPDVVPLIAVVPHAGTPSTLSVDVNFPANISAEIASIRLYPTGEDAQECQTGSNVTSAALDGHVVVTWRGETGEYTLIAPYSRGGGPASHNPAGANPVSAGSGEGNLLIFANPQLTDPSLESLYIITTTQLGEPYALNQTSATSHPCSYSFSIAANAPLTHADLGATAVFFFDNEHLVEGVQFRVQQGFANQPAAWLPDTSHYVSLSNSFAAIALNATTANGLLQTTPSPVFYRLYVKQ